MPNMAVFDKVVRGGAYRALGMPQFDYLTEQQLQSIQAYIVNQAWTDFEAQQAAARK